MGKHFAKHMKKIVQQKVNQQENKEFYQNGGEWKSPSSDRERTERRKLAQ